MERLCTAGTYATRSDEIKIENVAQRKIIKLRFSYVDFLFEREIHCAKKWKF